MEKSTAGTNKGSPDGLSHPNQNTIILNKIWYYFIKKWKKYNETQLTKNKMDLYIRKIANHPPSPVYTYNLENILSWYTSHADFSENIHRKIYQRGKHQMIKILKFI